MHRRHIDSEVDGRCDIDSISAAYSDGKANRLHSDSSGIKGVDGTGGVTSGKIGSVESHRVGSGSFRVGSVGSPVGQYRED